MPDKSGYEVCAFVRANAMLATTPVLLISGIVNDEVTKQAESCQANGVLKKPFQGTSLKDRVLELLAKRQEPAPPVRPAAVLASVEEGSEPRVTAEQLETYRHAVKSLQEMETQLATERTRAADSGQTSGGKGSQRGTRKRTDLSLGQRTPPFSRVGSSSRCE